MITKILANNWLIVQAELYKEKPAIITLSETITFKQFFERATEKSISLSKSGINENERVGLQFDHNYEFWITVNALWLIGAVPVPLNTRLTKHEMDFQIKKAGLKTIINNSTALKTELIETCKYNSHENVSKAGDFSKEALILFTSGTTSRPKAVVHTFESLSASFRGTDTFANLSSTDLWLASLPLYHIGGFMILVRSLLSGAAAAFPNSLRHEHIVEALGIFNPSHVSFVSTTMKKILDTGILPNKDIKMLFLGGGPLNDSLCTNAYKAGYPVIKVYGSTETCSMICALHSSEITAKPNSAGRVIGDAKIAIENGEILICSSTLFKEYLDDHNITKSSKVNGYYRTNDFGEIDDEGYLNINLRREDIIISGGENINAAEVEAAIKTIPQVSDAYVFGLPDIEWGQRVCAAIELSVISQNELIVLLKKNIAGYKIPKSIYILEKIPRNELGKINRSEVLRLLKLNSF